MAAKDISRAEENRGTPSEQFAALAAVLAANTNSSNSALAHTEDDPTDHLVMGLDRMAILVAQHRHPDVVLADELERLDSLAADFGGGTPTELMGWMGIRGFSGNAENYYNPENSYVPSVIDTGLGIPISLSILAIEIGRRSGIHLVGIGLPGEFLVAERDRPNVLHNPFRQRSMTPEDVEALVRRFAGQDVRLTPAMLAPLGTLEIMQRVLNNLTHIYAKTDQLTELEWVLRLQTFLPFATPQLHRQRVSVLGRLGRTWEASEALQGLMAVEAERGNDKAVSSDTTLLNKLRAHLN